MIKSLLVAACEKECILMFDPLNMRQLGEIRNAHQEGVNYIRFLDTRTFASCSDDSTVALWDARNLKSSVRTLHGHCNWVKNIEYSEKDSLLVTSGFDGSIYTWDINSSTEEGFVYNRVFKTTGLMRTRLTPDSSKMVITTLNGYIIVIHNLDLSTLAHDLDEFNPNMYRIMQLSNITRPEITRFNHLFSSTRKTNRLEFIDDFPLDNEAEIISSLQMHPQGLCVLSRNVSHKEKSEWTCIHSLLGDPKNVETEREEDASTSSHNRRAGTSQGDMHGTSRQPDREHFSARLIRQLINLQTSARGVGLTNEVVHPSIVAHPAPVYDVEDSSSDDEESQDQNPLLVVMRDPIFTSSPHAEMILEQDRLLQQYGTHPQNAPPVVLDVTGPQEEELTQPYQNPPQRLRGRPLVLTPADPSLRFVPTDGRIYNSTHAFMTADGSEEQPFVILRNHLSPRVLPRPIQSLNRFMDELLFRILASSSENENSEILLESSNEYFHKNKKRLCYYTEEPNVGRGFIKEPCFSSDGRVICSPYGHGIRLLSFDKDCLTIPYCIPASPQKLNVVLTNNCHSNQVLCCKFSPAHCTLVSGCLNGKIVWYQPHL